MHGETYSDACPVYWRMANCCHLFFGSGSLDLYYGSYLEGKEAVFCVVCPQVDDESLDGSAKITTGFYPL